MRYALCAMLSRRSKHIMSTFQILHISDLHFNEEKFKDEDFNRHVVLNPLIERIEEDRQSGFKPEIVVVSGDIAYKGKTAEYDEAKKFFNKLLNALKLQEDRIFIVPGNHDVNRSNLPKSIDTYKNMEDLNDDLKDESIRTFKFKGLTNYFSFVETNYGRLKSTHPGLVPFVHDYNTECGKRIGLVGLNTAWMCRRSTEDKGRIAIGEFQLLKAIEELKSLGDIDFIINIFHHPPDFLWEKDKKVCLSCFDQSMLLFGHKHDTDGAYIDDLSGRTFRFQAGSAYVGKETQTEKFNYITFDWKRKKIRLDIRKFDKDHRKWCEEGEKGKDSTKSFDMIKKEVGDQQYSLALKLKQDRIFKNYKNSALNEHRHLPTQGFETNIRISIELERVYVNMRAYIQSREFEYSIDGKTRMMEKIREERLTAMDIKAAFEAGQKHHIKDMVILGDPGSGKTTLLKYILVMLIQGRAEEKIGLRSDTIPFFVPLRELKDPGSEEFFPFIKRVCRLDKFSILDDDFRALLDSGRGIMLLDGLDEVADEKARIKICKWIDENRKLYARTPFVVTSRLMVS